MTPVANRLVIAGLILAALAPESGMLGAQEAGIGVDEARAIIPRAKVLRVTAGDSDPEETSPTRGLRTSEPSESPSLTTNESVIEVRPLEPLEGSTSGGGVVPTDDRVALQTDPTAPAVDGQDDLRAVRVITPTPERSKTDPLESAGDEAGTEEETAATSEDDDRPRWRRERTKRFKLAPEAEEAPDDSKPFAVPIEAIATGIKEGARLRQLDKMTGQTVTFDLANGESRKIDRLLVSLEACRSPENNATHGAMAFLNIRDTRNVDGDPDFTGWMFAESPALSALDHPRYDLWVINCITSDADVSAVNE